MFTRYTRCEESCIIYEIILYKLSRFKAIRASQCNVANGEIGRDEALFFFAVHVACSNVYDTSGCAKRTVSADIIYIYNYNIPAKSNIVVLYIKINAETLRNMTTHKRIHFII